MICFFFYSGHTSFNNITLFTMLTVVQDRLATKKEGSKQGGGVAAPLRLE